MAIEYDIYIKCKTNIEKNSLEDILVKNNFFFKKINTSRWLEYDMYDSNGFYITIISEYPKRFEIKNSFSFDTNELWSFRVNKEFQDPVQCRKSILLIIKSLLKNQDINVLLISNGELLILVKLAETGLMINSNSGYFDNGVKDFIEPFSYSQVLFSPDDIEIS